MYLNNISPEIGSRKLCKRKGRGIGSGFGKTSGRGHKGQKSRSGGKVSIRFEGGQTPLYRRIPKNGFVPLGNKKKIEIRLSDLLKFSNEIIDLKFLKKCNFLSKNVKNVKDVKIILSGIVTAPLNIRGLSLTKGAYNAVKNFGGKIWSD
ncbi:50S ribosomal protein L15 [Buchnera aphidicola (Schlechtendalia chinensis)]|uniref:Large ribosomal subunit protein uL15 n=1 Tax=Buchnera aphidicola subsp. Schlechtendalia chinensis TaxID=118110 RepID=A0A172WE30_BUCSC|nr:50S ribosomal protein L15 [Buchnera aphidicola]ANF17207.1 50S ribosomal protein L15 [Buchnera aphidicola (Schlechtendalia chinensis)]